MALEDDFALAVRAFEVSGMQQKRRILIEFAHLKVQPVESRFLEAVANFVDGQCLSEEPKGQS